jgi:serine/threonine protein kinase
MLKSILFSTINSRNSNNKISVEGKEYNKNIQCDNIKLIQELKRGKKGKLNPNVEDNQYKLTCKNNDNNYIIGEQIGKGSFNKVYELINDKNKVIRITYHEDGDNAKDKTYLENEISGLFIQYYISNILKCENVCKVYEFGYLEPPAFFKKGYKRVYAIIEKLTILNTIHFYPDLKKEEYNFKKIIYHSLKGLKCMNDNRFVHLDIKLENIGVDNNNIAKLYDFGFSRYIPIDLPESNEESWGTSSYIDPDYVKNKKFSIKSDIYSFGKTLLTLYFTRCKKQKQNVQEIIVGHECYNRSYYNHSEFKDIEGYFDDTSKLINLIKNMTMTTEKRSSLDDVLNDEWFKNSNVNAQEAGGKRKYKSKKNKSSRRKKNKTVKTI